MPYKVVTTTNDRLDIKEAIEWEDERKPGLSDYFLQDLQQKITDISKSPFIGALRFDPVRCTPTNIFQYLIYYAVDELPALFTYACITYFSQTDLVISKYKKLFVLFAIDLRSFKNFISLFIIYQGNPKIPQIMVQTIS